MHNNLFIAAGIFHPEAGGPATYLYELLPALQAREWSPQVLTYGDAPTDTYPYPVTRVPRRTFPLRLADYALKARRLVPDADLIYAHTIDLPLPKTKTPKLIKIVGDQAWERCIRRGWVPATTDVDEFQSGAFGQIVAWQRNSRSRQVRNFDGVIVPSEYLKQMVQGWGVPEDRIHVIYNAMPPAPENQFASQAAAREHLELDKRPTIFTAARLTPWKGIDHLITAIKNVPDARLIVAGDGSEMQRLRELATPLGERVQLLGRIPREAVYAHMQAADYFALYSGYEGLPHTILESLRVGTPVIASEKGGNPEVVQHDVNGLLVPYVDVEALTQTIQNAFSAGKRDVLAEKTAQGLERFDFENMVVATDEVLSGYLIAH